MNELSEKVMTLVIAALIWVRDQVISYETLGQIGGILVAFLAAYGLVQLLLPRLRAVLEGGQFYQRIAPFVEPLYLPLLWLFFVEVAIQIAGQLEFSLYLLRTCSTLLALWMVIRLASNVIRNESLARAITSAAWAIAALNILGLLEPMLEFLDQAAVTFGESRISALGVISGILTLVILIWLALFIARVLEQSLEKVTTLTPSAQVLLGKLAKILLIVIAVLMAISSTGIDLTALAVLGGAIGLGIGFGLQKVVSNLISGVILLLDRSIKPGDVVEVSGSYGWINKLAARYTSVITRDGREILVPNEDMITQPVINWTYSDSRVRRSLPVGVAYSSDLPKAMDLILEAAAETDRVLKYPKPNCLIKSFGDSAIDLELRMWIEDPQNGVSNVASLVYLKIWEKFQQNGVEIPFPQQDTHLVSAPVLNDPKVVAALVKILGGKSDEGAGDAEPKEN